MSAPRTKRQFAGAASDPAQRQITSFFNNSSSSNHTSVNQLPRTQPTTATLAGLPSSSLPASVQSNLISVGMRVRKSVPEGYKTGSYSAFALWDESESSSLSSSPASAAAAMMGAGNSNEGRSRANAFSTPRELLPFCGINKVGGLDTQPEHHADAAAAASSSDIDNGSSSAYSYQHHQRPSLSVNGAPLPGLGDLPGLMTSSQDPMDSTESTILDATSFTLNANSCNNTHTNNNNGRKRVFTEDEDEVPDVPDRLDVRRPAASDLDGEVSPRSLVPVGWGNGRVMAVPRKGGLLRRGKQHVRQQEFSAGSGVGAEFVFGGQENVMGDFEEAEFLDRGVWEVEMSDV